MSTLFRFIKNTPFNFVGVWPGTELELLLYIRQYYQHHSASCFTNIRSCIMSHECPASVSTYASVGAWTDPRYHRRPPNIIYGVLLEDQNAGFLVYFLSLQRA